MQINELPAGASFSNDDVIAIEINGVTYKLTGATLAAALKTLGNFVKSTGDSMKGQLIIDVPHATPMRFKQTNGGGSQIDMIGFANGTRSQFGIRQYTPDVSHYEDYYIPETPTSVSTNVGYQIMTTKPMNAAVQSAARTALGNSWHSIFDNFLMTAVTSNGVDADITSSSVTLPAGNYLVIANAFVHQNTGSGRLKFKYGSTSIEAVISSGHVGASAGVYAMVMGQITSTGAAQTASLTINSGNANYTMTAKTYMQYRAIAIRI